MMKKLKPTIVLTAICLTVALLLSVVNIFTAPKIIENQNNKANSALVEVLPGATGFAQITVDDSYPAAIKEAYKANLGFVFRTSTTGYGGELVVMIGVDNEGKIAGTKVVTDKETDTKDALVFPNVQGTDGAYSGMSLDGFTPYIASGATVTSNAFASAVKAALQAFVIANGGDVDIRTPEQILQDDCNAALGTDGLTFTKWFATEYLEGVDATYESEEGVVFKLGDKLIGYKDGAPVGEISEEEGATVEAAYSLYSASTLTEITKPETVTSKNIQKIYVTDSGNYVFDLVAEGYQALFEYGTGAKIYITVSISADGRIIDCVTTEHSESKGYGDACATEDYYNSFKGASNGDIKLTVTAPDYMIDQIAPDNTDIGVIASATYTTYGYQKAIRAAFNAFEILKGEA